MRKKNIRSMILIACTAISAGIGLSSCDSDSADSVTGSNSSTTTATTATTAATSISGKVLAEAGGGYTTARICLRGGTCTAPDANGNYSFAGTSVTTRVATASANASARASAVVLDTAYIIVGNDTLREIPIYSWSQVLPTGYVIQRNAKVVPPTRFLGNTIQAVYWTSDSIANVVDLGSASSTSYSGYLYTYYDSTAFANNTILFSWFARVKRNDSVVAYSSAANVKAHAGDIEADSTDFKLVSKYGSVKGYSYVPADSSVAMYNATRSTRIDSFEITNSAFGGSAWVGVRPNGKDTTALTTTDSMSLVGALYEVLITSDTQPKANGDTGYGNVVMIGGDGVWHATRVDLAFHGAYVSLTKSFTSGTADLNNSLLDSVIVTFNSDTSSAHLAPTAALLLSNGTTVDCDTTQKAIAVGHNRIAYSASAATAAAVTGSTTVTGIKLASFIGATIGAAINYTDVHVWLKFKNQ